MGVYEVPVRRKLLAEATDRVKRSALIILTGDGGNGKSVAAWHLSRLMLENPTVKPISVGSYSPQELLDAVEQDLPMHIERFERLLSPQVAPALDVGIIDTAFSPIPKEVLEALAHPAMWYALRRLQPEDHANLLDGNSETLDLLAKYFLSWFYEKAWRRHPQWNRDDVAEALSAIALRAFATQSAQFPFEIWLEVSRCDYILQGRQIHQHLYHEALSAGIIRETGRRIWDWRHPFVGRFLARKATEEGMQ